MFMSEWREFPSEPCLAGKKKHLMSARVSMVLNSSASLTCFRASFLPGWANDLSAHRYMPYTADVHSSVLIGTASHPDMQKIRIIELFFEKRLSCRMEFQLILFTV